MMKDCLGFGNRKTKINEGEEGWCQIDGDIEQKETTPLGGDSKIS